MQQLLLSKVVMTHLLRLLIDTQFRYANNDRQLLAKRMMNEMWELSEEYKKHRYEFSADGCSDKVDKMGGVHITYAWEMGQRSNDAAVKDARTKFRKEGCP